MHTCEVYTAMHACIYAHAINKFEYHGATTHAFERDQFGSHKITPSAVINSTNNDRHQRMCLQKRTF